MEYINRSENLESSDWLRVFVRLEHGEKDAIFHGAEAPHQENILSRK